MHIGKALQNRTACLQPGPWVWPPRGSCLPPHLAFSPTLGGFLLQQGLPRSVQLVDLSAKAPGGEGNSSERR